MSTIVRPIDRKNKQGGFILVTVMVVLAVISIGAGFLAGWVDNLRDSARIMKAEGEVSLDRKATEATLLYLLGTQRMTYGGLSVSASTKKRDKYDMGASDLSAVGSEISLDDSLYLGLGDARFSIQDEGGLFNLNFFRKEEFRQMLGYWDVPASKKDAMMDALLDYVDDNNFHRINGAEEKHYRQRKLNGPANRPLTSPLELNQVLGWAEEKQLWESGTFLRYTTTRARNLPNINTAPIPVLMTLPGVGMVEAQKIVDARSRALITTYKGLNDAVEKQLSLEIDSINRFPSPQVRLSIWSEGGASVHQLHVELTPGTNDKAPWSIAYERTIKPWPAISDVAAAEVESPLFEARLPTN